MGFEKKANPHKHALLALLAASGASAGLGAGVTAASGMLKDRKIPTAQPDTQDVELPVKKAFSLGGLLAALKGGAQAGLSHPAAPWAIPAAGLALPASLMAGSSMAQGAVHGSMKHKQQGELDDAKQDFEDSVSLTKKSTALFDLVKNASGLTTGLTVGAGGLLGLLAAYGHGAGHDFANKRTQEELLGKAVKNKDYLNSLRQVTPIDMTATK